jgi:acetolactate synthase II small subunit
MRTQLTIEAHNSPELLERLLRIVRHRGFSVQTLQAETANNEQNLQLNLTLDSEREISLLTKQLEKTFGVTQVRLLTQQAVIKASA